MLAELEAINDAGHTMRAQVAARWIGVLIGLQGTVNPLTRCPSFRDLRALPPAEQARVISNPTLRAVLATEFSNGSAQRMVNLANTYVLGTPPDYEPDPANTIAARATRLGREPADLLIELLAADDGKALLYASFTELAQLYVGRRLPPLRLHMAVESGALGRTRHIAYAQADPRHRLRQRHPAIRHRGWGRVARSTVSFGTMPAYS